MERLAIVAVIVMVVKSCTSIIVTTDQGRVLGSVKINWKGGQFYSFTSIPYAKPPLGHLRFMPPEFPVQWDGVLNATVEPPSCYQVNPDDSASEDCLYLNVFTRTLPSDVEDLSPVMVYFHGGGYQTGSSRTDLHGPHFLMTEDIVLVTVNYRLDILGFLSVEDESLGATGNAGLKDQVAALKWINKNIKYFGGDSNSVTLFGESAGAASAELHTLSAQSQGLFHKIIMESGSVLDPWSLGIKGNIKSLAEKMGLQTDDESDILATLKSLPVEQLYFEDDLQVKYFRRNAPVVEADADGAFLVAEPRKLLESGQFSKIPTLIGYSSDEGMAWYVVHPFYRINWTDFVPNVLVPNNDTDLREAIAEEISEFYLTRNYGDAMKMGTDVITDSYFLHGIYATLKSRLAASTSPVYFYRFSMSSRLNLIKNINPLTALRPGAVHTEDTFYLLKNHRATAIEPGSLEDEDVRKMVKLWTNFAIYGNPTAETDEVLNVTWPAATKDRINYLEIGNTFTVGEYPDKERTEFWETLYDKYYKP